VSDASSPAPLSATAVAAALVAADPRLERVFAASGPFEPDRTDETAPALIRSVVYQQLSGKAAATIHGRVLTAFGDGETPNLAALAAAPDDALRACGLSRAKSLAVRDIAERALDGRLPDRAALAALPDDEIERALVAVRGVGPWTAQMLMMFTLARPDVWPVLDLGVQEGFRILSGATVRPTPAELAIEGERYRPFRSAAAWAMWRVVDLSRAEERTGE
jgi:DNA-3-methyladenine glycosylase II